MENWKTKNKIVIILEKILKVDNQNQRGQVLKILTSSQMLSRLSITLAQSKTRNNSEKTWNERRQLLYSFHRWKKFRKTDQFYLKMEAIFINPFSGTLSLGCQKNYFHHLSYFFALLELKK